MDDTSLVGIGIDGCRAGWLAVTFDGEQAQMFLLPQISEVDGLGFSDRPVWIDMPIGLIDEGPEGRACDSAARKYLSPVRHSSVFTPPCRAAVYVEKEVASQVNFRQTGKKISQQSLNIIPKIRELDTFLQGSPVTEKQQWYEAHPEVVFGAFNEGQPLVHRKKTKEGEEQRLSLLKPWYPEVFFWFARVRQHYLRKHVLPDDIIDALGLAVANYLIQAGRATTITLPSTPAQDSTNLPMRIVYPQLP